MDNRYPSEIRRVPTLRYDCHAQRWELNAHGYHIKIKYAWNGESWCEYRYFVMHDGHEREALTAEQMRLRLNAIVENEGEKAAGLWLDEQQQVLVVRENHDVFHLKDIWEAMLTLGIFCPSVTHREWESAPLHEELRIKMDTARDLYQRGQHDEDGSAGERSAGDESSPAAV